MKKHYPDSKSDLFAVFIERCNEMIKKNAFQGMITQHAWMFLSSYEKLRAKLLKVDIVNMAHLGARAFEEIGGEVVQTTSFVLRKSHIADCKGEYCRLIEPTTQQGKEAVSYTHLDVYKRQNLKSGSAKDKIDAAMKSLVESVYSKLNMVNQFADTDADVFSILNSPQDEITFTGLGANNEDALNDISQWLELRNQKMLKTSMGDVQDRYQKIPYGWKEIDIAALIARPVSYTHLLCQGNPDADYRRLRYVIQQFGAGMMPARCV